MESFSFVGEQFYPTPENLANKMVEKVDWKKVSYVLEPSAGKGDIVKAIRNRKDKSTKNHIGLRIDCVEIDPILRGILKESKKCSVVASDFLAWETHTRYDAILMNPPFKYGDKHLLKAIYMLEHGGQIVCILNAETLRKDKGNTRKDLINKLDEYNAEVEFISNAFSDAERKTDVEIALIYISIPFESEKPITLDGMKKAAQIKEDLYDVTDIVSSDFVKAIVQRYNMEAKIGLKILDQFETLNKYIGQNRLICCSVVSPDEESKLKLGAQNTYLMRLRYKYWEKLFSSKEMSSLMTRDIREKYMGMLREFEWFDFNEENIHELRLELSKGVVESMEDAIIKMFDFLTYQNSMDKQNNVHYYSGWKTNNACAIGKKSIISAYGLYDSRWGGHWSEYKARDVLEELEKVLTYLDNGRTDGVECGQIIRNTVKSGYNGERFSCKFFDLEFKKKGTVHIYYTDMALIKKLNIFAGKKKNWLPYDYGKKDYSEMSEQEKSVAQSFEGIKSYKDTHDAVGFYTVSPMIMIGSGEEQEVI